MKFQLKKASDWKFKETIEINSLEDLKEFQIKSCEDFNNTKFNSFDNPPLIIDFIKMKITIYDSYME